MAGCRQKFLPQAYTTVAHCQEKKGSIRTKIIEAVYTKSGGVSLRDEESGEGEMISFPVASELLAKIRTRQCRVPTILFSVGTRLLECPLYVSAQ